MNTTRFDSNPEWVAGRITSNAKKYAISLTCLTVFWSVISVPCVYFAFKDETWLALVFPAIGVLILLFAVHAWYHWFTFGPSEFAMDQTPAPIGGQLSGVVRLTRNLPDDYQFHLLCTRVRSSRGSKNRTGPIQEYKSAPVSVSATAGIEGTEIPIRIAIPDDAHETGRHKKDRRRSVTYTWRLIVKAKNSGFGAMYCIPVFGKATDTSTASQSSLRPGVSV